MASKPAPKAAPAPASTAKTAAMGLVAVVAIILSIVVAVKTFSDGSPEMGKPPTEPISGSWKRKADVETMAPPPGAPAEFMIAKDVEAFDASNATSGTVQLTMTGGKTQTAKVMNSQPGHLLLEFKLANGKSSQLTIAQMGEGGPIMVTDGISTVTFEPAN